MRKDLTPLTREKLIIAVQLNEAIDHVNTALAARKAELILDYTDRTMLVLKVGMPGVNGKMIVVPWLAANPRNPTRCQGYWPADPDLNALVHDIMERLTRLHAYIAIGVTTLHPSKKKLGKLQIFFQESKRMAITLSDVDKGAKKATMKFEPPKEFAQ